MADDAVKKLLIKLGISTRDWQTAVRDIKSQLNSVNVQAKKDAAQMKQTQKEQIDLTRQQIADQKRLTAEAQAMAAVDKAKAAWQQKQQVALKTAIAQKALETAEAKKQQIIAQAAIKLEQEKLRLQQQQLKIAQQQTKENEKQVKSEGGGERGGVMRGIMAGAAGVLGGGLVGSIAAGTIVGDAFEKIMEKVGEEIHHVAEAMVEATGKAGQLREQFQKLASRDGGNPEEFLNQLRVATRGLVQDNTQLIKTANAFMQGPLKLSQPQILKLTQMTIDLARAQGKDANEAMDALNRTALTGYARTLEWTLGLTRAEVQVRSFGKGVSQLANQQLQLSTIMDAMARRLAEVGTPATTLEEVFKQLHMIEGAFAEDMAYGLTHSKKFAGGIQTISKWLQKITPEVLDFALSIGEKLGEAIQVVTPLFKGFEHLVLSLGGAFDSLITGIDHTIDALIRLGTQSDKTSSKFSFIRVYISSMSKVFESLSFTIDAASLTLEYFYDKVAHPTTSAGWDTFIAKLKKRTDEFTKAVQAADIPVQSGQTNVDKDGKTNPPPLDPAILNQRLQLQMQIEMDSAKIRLEQKKQEIQDEENLEKTRYEQGLSDLKDYLAKQAVLKKEESNASIDLIKNERDARLKQLKIQRQGTYNKDTGQYKMDAGFYALNRKKINDDANAQIEKEQTRLQQELFGIANQGLQDQQAAYKEHVTALNKIAQDGVQQRLQILEKEFSLGNVNADTYLQQKKDLVNAEYIITFNGLELQRKAAENNLKENQKINDQEVQAAFDKQKKLDLINEEADEARIKYLKTSYHLATKPLQTQVEYAQGDITGQSFGLEDEAKRQLLITAQDQLKKLQQTVPSKEGNAMQMWREEVSATRLEIQKLNIELIKMHSNATPLGGIFGAVSSVAGAIPRSKTAAGVSELFGNMQSSMSGIATFQAANSAIAQKHAENLSAGLKGSAAGPSNIISQLGDSFSNLFKHVKDVNGKLEPMSDKLKSFESSITSVVAGVTGAIQGITGGKTAAGGALSGGMSGMQLGAQFGPLGGIIGGIGGAVMGGIFGSKENHLMQDIHKVQTQLQSIVSDLQAGTISLSQAIQDLRNERQQAIALLSNDPKGGKGGGKGGKKGYSPTQAQAVIQQIDEQIQTLVNQQTQLLNQLNESLMELSQPAAFQDYLQSLDQIISKYQQFASAAQGNAQEVANANQYLNDSLQQYVTTLSQNLNQAQQQAINDALTLINLEYQRQQLINQEAQQEYDVLTQGVAVRQRTTAMTKGQEIGVMRYQRDMQLEQMDEEISLQKYKVDSETKIFGLATTRIGLETQLLEAQEEQANYQIQQVQALAQVVADLQAGLSGGQLMQAIETLMATGNMPTGPGIMMTLLQELGLAGNVPPGATGGQYGTTNWLAAIPSTYASAAQFVGAIDPNFIQDIISGNYSAAASDAQQYAQQGEVEGFDMNDLIAWLKASPNVPSKSLGGSTGDGGLVMTHPDEWILPAPIVSTLKALGSVMGGTPNITSSDGVQNTSLMATHSALLDMTTKRANVEMSVVSARQSQLQMEMQYLSSLNDTVATIQNMISNGSSPSSSLEGMLAKTYELRGRYGAGNFRRETL